VIALQYQNKPIHHVLNVTQSKQEFVFDHGVNVTEIQHWESN